MNRPLQRSKTSIIIEYFTYSIVAIAYLICSFIRGLLTRQRETYVIRL